MIISGNSVQTERAVVAKVLSNNRLRNLMEVNRVEGVGYRWETEGLQAKSGPPPCFIQPGTLFLPSGSAKLSLNC